MLTPKISILSIAILSALTLSTSSANIYLPQLEVSLKSGNQRSIARPSMFIPLLQTESSVLYGAGIGMFDSKDNKEFNLGVGYRNILSKNILGVYGYFDRRFSKYKTNTNQITMGAELLSDNYEFWFNEYIPLTETKKFGDVVITGTKYYGNNQVMAKRGIQQTVTALGGFDVEGGFAMPD